MAKFVDFGLDPICKMLHKFRIKTGFGLSWVHGKELHIFCRWKAVFFNF